MATSAAPIESSLTQSDHSHPTEQISDQGQQNWFQSCFEWIRGCWNSCCSGIRSLPVSFRNLIGRSFNLLRDGNTEAGNNGIVLQPENIPSYPAYMEEPPQDRVANIEQSPQTNLDSFANLETDCDSIPIINCVLQMSEEKSIFSVE
ncbi:hypothetical protein HNY73_002693 [Argiope bruennichi]|uniref:Uncharacterized protein n=1 Tax=Argiope bruennichi TaxID=94029 RepID=A0A8T0FUH8_ARGBR|nr:hypothetical protein HNY73_002693 [Argiope bruennichi]